MTQQVQAVGLAWYMESDYQRLKALFTNSDKLPATFLMWQDRAEQIRKRCIRQSLVVVQAYIDPDTFPAWCAERGLNVDAKGRTAFANAEARRIAVEMQRDERAG